MDDDYDDYKEFYEDKSNPFLKHLIICPKCKTNNDLKNDESNGACICTKCGLTLNEYSIVLENEHYHKNCKLALPMNVYLQQSSVGTTVNAPYYCKIKMYNTWYSIPYKERSLIHVYKEISQYCSKGNIPQNVEQDAKILFRIFTGCKFIFGKNKGKVVITRGDHRNSFIGSCIFMACKRNNIPRTTKEIAKIVEVKISSLNKGIKTFVKLMKSNENTDVGLSTTEHFITRFGKQCHLDLETLKLAETINENIRKHNIATEHTTIAVAIACIALACEINKKDIDRKTLAVKFDVSYVTLTKIYKKIEFMSGKILKEEEIKPIVIPIEILKKQKRIKLKRLMNYIHNAAIDDPFLDEKINMVLSL